MAGAVRELGFDAAVLAHVVRGADELLARTVVADERGDVDRNPPGRDRRSPLGFERDRAALARGTGEGAHVRDQRVGGHDVAQVAGRGVVAEQPAVGVVRVDETEDVVAVDRDRERGMREQVEQRRVGAAASSSASPVAAIAGRGREARPAPRSRRSPHRSDCHRAMSPLPEALFDCRHARRST